MKFVFAAFYLLIASFLDAQALKVSLEEALNLAVEQSNDVISSRYAYGADQFKYSLSYRRYLPSLGIQAGQTQSVRIGASDSQTVTWSGNLKQPLFLGVSDLYSGELADQNFQEKSLAITSAEETARDACWQAFITYLSESQKGSLIEASLSLARDQEKIALKEYELGSIKEIDLVDTQLQVAGYEQQVKAQKQTVEKSIYSLKKLLAIPKETAIDFVGELPQVVSPLNKQITPSVLFSKALSANLDLLKARSQIRKLQIQETVSNLDFIPALDLEAGVNLNGDNYPLDRWGYNVKLNVRLPFKYLPIQFSIGYTSNPGSDFGTSNNSQASVPDDFGFLSDMLTASFQLNQTVAGEEKLRSDLRFTFESKLGDLNLLYESQELQKKVLTLGERKAAILKKQVELGEAKRIDYLKAVNDLLTQKLSALDSTKQIILAERELEKLAGFNIGELTRQRESS